MRMRKDLQFMTYLIGGGLWVTGVLWLIFHYFMVRQSDFGAQPHPLEHWWLSMHGLFAFATLWLFGLLWGRHIVGGWKSERRRISGSLLLVVLLTLVITGYLLYYPPTEDSLSVIALVHWLIGIPIVGFFVVHRFWRRLARRSQVLRVVRQ